MASRESFSGKLGLLLTAAGAVVGLGSLWRFPYLTGQNGGGIFILFYFILMIALGLPLLITEFAIGRKTQTGVLGAFKNLHPKYGFLGIFSIAAILLTMPYYSIIGAESAKYGIMYISGHGAELLDPAYYTTYSAEVLEPLLWLGGFLLLTAIVGLFGLRKGIERLCKVVMPAVIFLLIGLTIFCLTLPGALDGLYYYLMPDFSTFKPETILAAMGQVFYSLSLGFGVIVTLGSYMSKNESISSSAKKTLGLTFFVALLAGSLIIPASYICTDGNPAILGTGTVFESLPVIFESMSPAGGSILGTAFFLLLSLSALAPVVIFSEVIITALYDRFSVPRKVGVGIMAAALFIIGAFISLGYGPLSWIQIGGRHIFEIFDFTVGNILLPVTALLTCILMGYCLNKSVILDETKLKHPKLFMAMLRYFCPACILAIFIYNITVAFF
ncbi:MAG TPA: sodium-dependent transporter [Methanocorpusculum sp.]|nr:sodium-dependent transporter [Methanocorpusculum sp.]